MFREGHMIGWLPQNYPGVNFQFAPIPKAKFDGMGITGVDSWGTLVYKFGPNKDAAWNFLDKVVLTADNDLASSKNVGFVPAFKANWDGDYMKGRKDYAVQQYALAHSAGVMYMHPLNNKLADRQAQAVQEALLGKKKPKDALDQAATDMENIIKSAAT
jgi:ABC-type glycerol-3-phosphate transport system substrate-binding protein